MNDFEQRCYGMSEADIQSEYMESFTARMSGLEMVVMSMLFDAQELIACNSARTQEQARQELNRAKYILSMLSDAQELIACNSARTQEQARQELNRAKYILSRMLEEKSKQLA